MKLTSYYFNELNEEQQIRIMNNFCEHDPIVKYLDGLYSYAIVNAQVVVDEDFHLCDIKVYDPYNLIQNPTPVYINWMGWSNWLFDYRDKAGHNMDRILYRYGGETQGD